VRTGAKSVIADCPVVVVLSTSLVAQTERILHSQIRSIQTTHAKYQHYVTRLTEKRFRVLKTMQIRPCVLKVCAVVVSVFRPPNRGLTGHF